LNLLTGFDDDILTHKPNSVSYDVILMTFVIITGTPQFTGRKPFFFYYRGYVLQIILLSNPDLVCYPDYSGPCSPILQPAPQVAFCGPEKSAFGKLQLLFMFSP
jgi:hypothetical protein